MGKKQKVLIVDDEPRNIRIITEILEDVVEIKTVGSGEEALKIAEQYDPDLILLDIMMPGIDGYHVCKQIKQNPALALTKIILVSGKAMLDERLQGYAAGADDYMTKPFIPEELLAKAKVFLRLTLAEKENLDLNHSLEIKVQERTKQLMDTESKLITAAKMAALGEMAGGIAHEINTPLSTIRLVSEQIEDLIKDDPIVVDTVANKTQVISNTVQRISVIIGGLRNFSRDGSKDRIDWVPLNRLFGDTLALCGEKIKYNNIRIFSELLPDDLRIYCRAVPMSQVFLNLISNACDAVSVLDEKWIKIEAERKNGFIEICITDSGLGIPEKVSAKMFQPFFTTKEIGKGTGLGLSISKGIIEAHHGQMFIDSHSPHTRFVMQLPESQTIETSLKQCKGA